MVGNAVDKWASVRSGRLKVRIIGWNTHEKGVDDFIVAQGVRLLSRLTSQLYFGSVAGSGFTRLTYPASPQSTAVI